MENEKSQRPDSSQGTPTTRIAPRYAPPITTREARRENRPHHVPVLGPALLILAGSIFLLNNLGLLPWNLWGQLWRLWPLIPIAIGLDLILGRRSSVLSLITVIGVIAAGVVILYNGGGFESNSEAVAAPASVIVPLEGAKIALVKFDFGTGDLALSSLEVGSGQLALGTLKSAGSRKPPVVESNREGDSVQLEVRQQSDRFGSWFGADHERSNWNIKLNPTVPLNLEVHTGASNVDLNLERLQVNSLKLDVGASDTRIVFPAQGPSADVQIHAGAARVTLLVPEGVATSIDVSASRASSVNIVDPRFTQRGKTYETEGYATAARKLTIKLDLGAASISVAPR